MNISKSQLQRINSMEKLTDKVKQAIDDKKISETAAMEMSTMTAEEQDVCLEKILSGEMKGTVQEIQKLKSSKPEEEKSDNIIEEESATEKMSIETTKSELEPVSEEYSERSAKVEEKEKNFEYPKKYLQTSEKSAVTKIMDVPEEFGDPQKEAEEWFFQESIALYEAIYEEAKRLSEEETNELKAAQWGIRASVARYNIEEMKLNHNG